MIQHSLLINATTHEVWDTLTKPELMKQWMGYPEIDLEIVTDWVVGSPFIVKGFHHITFENKGVVEVYEEYRRLKYTALSSVSRLADKPENYTSTEFILEQVTEQTKLTIQVDNFPTETILRHYDFYWRGTIMKIKQLAES